MNTRRQRSMLPIIILLTFGMDGWSAFANEPPVADAGLSRYIASEIVQLDGTRSYDPDETNPLSYEWQQISGPSVVIINANTATPTVGMDSGTIGRGGQTIIDGFIQTDEIQECEFELVVSDGELESLPETVKVVIVPDFGPSTLALASISFDTEKPTVIYFGGGYGGCLYGYAGQPWLLPE